MKENKYDHPDFFEQYSQMNRSVKGLAGAGEWHELRKILPEFLDKRVLDLGCGFGWHCQFAAAEGAKLVIGTDISSKMLAKAKDLNQYETVSYEQMAIEDVAYPPNAFDIIISSLVFHYIASFEAVCHKVYSMLAVGGTFIFSVEHPVFTAHGSQDWYRDDSGKILHWPVDHYFATAQRQTTFLGETMTKYHRTVADYINTPLAAGFTIERVVEPIPDPKMLDVVAGMRDELRRPIFLMVSSRKISA